MKRKIFFICLGLLIVALAPACSAMAKPTPTTSPEPATATVNLPTKTPQPTFTVAPTATETIVPTETETPMPSATSTPSVQYAQYKLLSVSQQPYGMLLGFQIPGLKEPLITRINTQLFKCTMEEKYPERMFCSGPALPLDKNLDVVFYAADGSDPVYTGELIIASQIFKAPTPANIDGSNACPDDLDSVTCETENRTDNAGNPCKVSTCVNRCGYLYSVNTCPDLH
jgi:hypothetical protein